HLVDSDEWIRARTGMTVEELWRRGGEAAYRPHEQAVVSETLAGPGPEVLTVPAGAVEDPIALAELRRPGVLRVWLRAEVDTLVRRVAASSHRPLLDDDPRSVLEAQSATRSGTFEELADLVIDVDATSAEAAARLVVDRIPDADRR
ncbi:MAG: 3-dehydroquinate synthase, partial [Actinobacteria bacterium]|nr:3-dehydroquinate synthase [Actinomycetota bacterium]